MKIGESISTYNPIKKVMLNSNGKSYVCILSSGSSSTKNSDGAISFIRRTILYETDRNGKYIATAAMQVIDLNVLVNKKSIIKRDTMVDPLYREHWWNIFNNLLNTGFFSGISHKEVHWETLYGIVFEYPRYNNNILIKEPCLVHMSRLNIKPDDLMV